MNGFRKVFAFTLKQTTNVKMYRMLTLIVALILFLLPAIVLPLMERGSVPDTDVVETVEYDENGNPMEHPEDSGDYADVSFEELDAEEEDLGPKPEIIYLVDDCAGFNWYEALKSGIPGYEKCQLIAMDSIEAANVAGNKGDASLILHMSLESEEGMDHLMIRGLIPDESICYYEVSWNLVESIYDHLPELMMPDLSEAQLERMNEIGYELEEAAAKKAEEAAAREEAAKRAETEQNGESTKATEAEQNGEPALGADMPEEEYADAMQTLQEMFGFILPYLNIILIYFLVLYYGQTVANNVIQEKSSKLMDTMLISVKPGDMILGKVVATWIASLIQFMTWMVALFVGLGLGTKLALAVNPNSQNMVLFVLEMFKGVLGSFALPSLLLAILLVLAGFFLYCALSSIGGSLASKPEELSSTNIVFVVILIGSFFAALSSGFMSDGGTVGLSLYDCIPFTAVLLSPSRILLGQLSFAQGCISLGLMLALSVVLMLFAGKVYTMMAMYRGKAPNPKQLFMMLRGR